MRRGRKFSSRARGTSKPSLAPVRPFNPYTGELSDYGLMQARAMEENLELLQRESDLRWQESAARRRMLLEVDRRKLNAAINKQQGDRHLYRRGPPTPRLTTEALVTAAAWETNVRTDLYFDEMQRKARADAEWQKVLERDRAEAARELCEEARRLDNNERRHHLIREGHGGRNGHRKYHPWEKC